MTAFRTRAKNIEQVAGECEAMGRQDLAALLRTAKKPGPKSTRDEFGFTPHEYNLAETWKEMDDRIENGEDESDVILDVAKCKNQSYDQILNLRLLYGYAKVRSILKREGRL